MQLLAIGGSVIAGMLLFAAWLFVLRKACCECCACAYCEDRVDDWDEEMTEASKNRRKVRRGAISTDATCMHAWPRRRST